MKGKIYILIDPDTNKIRYVGMTKLSLKHRLSLHLTEKKKITHKSHWINSLKDNNKKPKIFQIDSSSNLEELATKEINWIQYYLRKREKLTNFHTTFSVRPYKSLLDRTAKRVIQYDLKGNKIAEFASANEAACVIGDCTNNPTIYAICNGNKNYTFKGFVFRFEGDSFDKFKIVGVGEHKCPKYHKEYLSKQAKKRNKKFTREHYIKANSMIKNRRGTPRKKVIEISTNKIFDSIMIASSETNVPKTTISRHCNNTIKNPLFKFQDIVQSS
jgi:hypothetical protein